MNFLGKYEEKISKMPKTAIFIIVIVTLFMSFFAAQVDMDSGENDFQPDSEVAVANQKISENYGSQANQISVIFISEGNVLDKESLISQLNLEEEILNSDVTEIIDPTSQNPSGISSPAKLIAQGGFVTAAFNKYNDLSSTYGFENLNSSDIESIQNEFITNTFNLNISNLKTILEGGNLTLSITGIPSDFTLDFDEYTPEKITEYLDNIPFPDALSFLLSKEYNEKSNTASKALMSISIKNNLDEEERLGYEKNVQKLAETVEKSDLEARFLGDALVNEKINEASGKNIALLMPIAFGTVIVILIIIYRNLTDTILNLLSLIMSIIWVYGIGVILDFSFNPMMTTVPVLIIGLGIDYGIHYTLRYREELRKGESIDKSLIVSGATVGFAILLTTVTTVIGFLSNVSSNISSIRQFGILCSVGILSSFIIMLTFFPAAKNTIDNRKKKKGKKLIKDKKTKDQGWGKAWKKVKDKKDKPEMVCSSGVSCVNNALGFGAVAAKKPLIVILILALLTTAGAYGVLNLEPQYDFRDFLPNDLEITETFNILIDDFNFSEETVLILVEGDVTNPDVFKNSYDAQNEAMGSKYVQSSKNPESPLQLSLDLSRSVSPSYNQSFEKIWISTVDTNNDYKIDEDITQDDVKNLYDALYTYSEEDAKKVLNRNNKGDYQGFVIRIPVNTQNNEKSEEIKNDMTEASAIFDSSNLDRVIVTGSPIVSYSTFQSINEGQITTLLITFIISLIILTILYVKLKKAPFLGFIAILPLIFVISWTLGTMYFINIPLNPVTVTIAAITVGLGIDYSIHLTQRYLEDIEKIPDGECALCVSVSHTGSALFGSAITTVIGFGILSLAIIPPLAQFGQVSALSIFYAFLASVFVLPTFLLIWYKVRKKIKTKKQKNQEHS